MVPCGVPQGSILGPLLFLIYVNDMESAVKCKLILYEDDSALLVSGKDVKVIQETLEKELCALSSWLVDNKLSLLLGKTEAILFGSCKKICNSPSLYIKCGDTKISSKKSVRYLVITFVSINSMSHGLCMLFMVPWFAKEPKAQITNPSE